MAAMFRCPMIVEFALSSASVLARHTHLAEHESGHRVPSSTPPARFRIVFPPDLAPGSCYGIEQRVFVEGKDARDDHAWLDADTYGAFNRAWIVSFAVRQMALQGSKVQELPNGALLVDLGEL